MRALSVDASPLLPSEPNPQRRSAYQSISLATVVRNPLKQQNMAETALTSDVGVAPESPVSVPAAAAISSSNHHDHELTVKEGSVKVVIDPAKVLARAKSSRALAIKRKNSPYVRCSKYLVILSYLVIAVVSCLMIWQLVIRNSENHVIAWVVGGIFVLIALPVSLQDIHMHMLHYVKPALQRYYIRVIWMVPIYSIESWLGLAFKSQGLYLGVAREAYEAYVIFSFYHLLRTFLGTRQELVDRLKKQGTHAHMMFPMKYCLRPWKMGHEFIDATSRGVLQYVYVRLIVSLLTLILGHINGGAPLGEGSYSGTSAYVYFVVIVSISQSWALYCLVMFYHALHEHLKPIKPFQKFLTVKAVVFFSFWQSVLISLLVYLKVIGATLTYTVDDISTGLQDFLICIEMAFAAIAFHKYFSYRDFYAEIDAAGGRGQGVAAALVDLVPVEMWGDSTHHAKALLRSIGLRKSATVVEGGAEAVAEAAEGDDARPEAGSLHIKLLVTPADQVLADTASMMDPQREVADGMAADPSVGATPLAGGILVVSDSPREPVPSVGAEAARPKVGDSRRVASAGPSMHKMGFSSKHSMGSHHGDHEEEAVGASAGGGRSGTASSNGVFASSAVAPIAPAPAAGGTQDSSQRNLIVE